MKISERTDVTGQLIHRAITRARRDQKRGGPPSTPSGPKDRTRTKEFAKRREVRRYRVENKQCSNCGSGGLIEGFKMCLSCREYWREVKLRCRSRRVLSLTPCPLRIDLEGP
jgi:hypothetical protein